MVGTGTVYLVGAGPGDPDLLTVKGRECLSRADTVVYDSLANPLLLACAPDSSERIYVGKQAGCHSMKQEDINALLVAKAREGNTLVRLKGGDPFVFGRGAEEALALCRESIPFEIVPGVTAGVAAPAYAGIPVTYRELNSTLTFVTGHEDPNKKESAVNWSALAAGGGTIVFYMGMKNLPLISARLIREGMAADVPVAVIHSGTLPTQRVVQGNLENIARRTADAEMTPPAIILVGETAGLRSELRWFEKKPLFGRRILVTRSRTQASRLVRELGQLGAAVVSFPTIRIAPADSAQPLNEALCELEGFDWVLFTSANTVDSFFKALADRKQDSRSLAGCRVCAIGPGTRDRLFLNGIRADVVPERYTSKGILSTLLKQNAIKGKRFLLPRADIAPPELPDELTRAGGEVTDIVAYRTLPATPEPGVLQAIRSGGVDIVTFTSSSTARNFASLVRAELGHLPAGVSYASIGPETTKAATAEGMEIAVEAEQHDVDGLVEAVVRLFGNEHS